MTHPSTRRAAARSALLAGLATLALTLAAPAPRAQFPVGVTPDEWFVLELAGQPGGYAHMRMTEEPETGLTSSWMEMNMRMGRLGAEVEIRTETTQLETAEGQVVRMTARTVMGDEKVITAVVRGEDLDVTVEEQTKTRTFTQDWDPRVRGNAYWARRMADWLETADTGDTFEQTVYEPTLGSPVTIVNELRERGAEELTVASAVDIMPGMEQISRLTPAGLPISVKLDMMGIEMEMRSATREEALAAYAEGGGAPEVFAQTLIRPDRPLPRPRSLDRVVYRLVARDPSVPFPELEGPTQRVLSEADGELLLEVRRVVPGEDEAGGPAPVDEDREPNASVQSDDEDVVALADELAGDATDPWDVARRLERGVYEIVDKEMGVAFATASEVCRSRRGDCTEHAVLLAALCRARGVPARVAMGVVYLGGIFGGHAWTEAWVDDQWVALDGVFGLGSVDAAHIRFTSSSLAGVGMGAEMVGALMGLANFDVEIVETEQRGVVLRAEDHDEQGFSVDGRRFSSSLYAFSLEAPEGYVWSGAKPDWTSRLVGRAESGDFGDLKVYARAVSYDFGPDDLAELLGDEGTVKIPVRVDGRPGLLGDFDGWRLGVLDGDTMVVVSVDVDDEDEALEQLLAVARSMSFGEG